MSLIFDQFKSVEQAVQFMLYVKEEFGLGGEVFTSVEEAFAADPFPFDLEPPIVHIDRAKERQVEESVIVLVRKYGGRWAGT